MDVGKRTGLLVGTEIKPIGDAATGKDEVDSALVAPARLDGNDLLVAADTRLVGGYWCDSPQSAGPGQLYSDGLDTDSVGVQREAGLAIAALGSCRTPTGREECNARYQ